MLLAVNEPAELGAAGPAEEGGGGDRRRSFVNGPVPLLGDSGSGAFSDGDACVASAGHSPQSTPLGPAGGAQHEPRPRLGAGQHRPYHPGHRNRRHLTGGAPAVGAWRHQMVLLALTVIVGTLSVVPGRATRLHGTVHLVLLAGFLFLAINP